MFMNEYPLEAFHAETTTANGQRLSYLDRGEGPMTLVFLHGLTSQKFIWHKNIQILSKYFRCIAVDLPGHGFSTKENRDYTIEFFSTTLTEFFKAIGLEEAVLVGHSMGGQIAIDFAVHHRQLCSHLVLVAPAGFETFSETEKNLLEQFSYNSMWQSSQYGKMLQNLRHNAAESASDRLALEDFDKLHQNGLQVDPQQIVSSCTAGMLRQPVFHLLKRIEQPTLVFFGMDDKLIPNRFFHHPSVDVIAENGVRQLPDGRLRLLSGAGHYLQFEEADLFNLEVYKFLNRHIFQDA